MSRKINSNIDICKNCYSTIKIVDTNRVCSSDNLNHWNKEFIKFHNLDNKNKLEYLKSIAYETKFLELYDKWEYCKNSLEEFTCDYTDTNIIEGNVGLKNSIPDPIYTHLLEKKLGRKLTEEELIGEKDLLINGIKIEIPFISLPEEF